MFVWVKGMLCPACPRALRSGGGSGAWVCRARQSHVCVVGGEIRRRGSCVAPARKVVAVKTCDCRRTANPRPEPSARPQRAWAGWAKHPYHPNKHQTDFPHPFLLLSTILVARACCPCLPLYPISCTGMRPFYPSYSFSWHGHAARVPPLLHSFSTDFPTSASRPLKTKPLPPPQPSPLCYAHPPRSISTPNRTDGPSRPSEPIAMYAIIEDPAASARSPRRRDPYRPPQRRPRPRWVRPFTFDKVLVVGEVGGTAVRQALRRGRLGQGRGPSPPVVMGEKLDIHKVPPQEGQPRRRPATSQRYTLVKVSSITAEPERSKRGTLRAERAQPHGPAERICRVAFFGG